MKLGHVGLHTKLMLALALLVAVVAGGSAHFVVEHERERRLHELERRTERIAEVVSRALAQPLWDMDRKAIDTQLAARFPDSEVVEVSVTSIDRGPMSIVAGARGPDPTGERRRSFSSSAWCADRSTAWRRWSTASPAATWTRAVR